MMRFFIFCSFILLIASCNSYKVIHFTNSSQNFNSFKTYKLTNFKSDTTISSEGKALYQSLEKQLKEEMSNLGYSLVASSPDLLLRYEIISNVIAKDQFRNNYNRYNRTLYYDPSFYDIRQVDMHQSMLMIELLNFKTGKLVYQGSLDLNQSGKSKNKTELLVNAVRLIMAEYQPNQN